MLQKHYCVARLQHTVPYNVAMRLSSKALAIALALAVTSRRVHVDDIHIHIHGLPILLVLVLVTAGVVWARGRSRHGKNAPDRPDEWPPRDQERRPTSEKEDPPPWQ